jgi:hypothetical protein
LLFARIRITTFYYINDSGRLTSAGVRTGSNAFTANATIRPRIYIFVQAETKDFTAHAVQKTKGISAMQRCCSCLMPSSRPDVPFDETGQCQACTNYQNRPNIDWAARKAALVSLLDRFDGRVIVPSSAGKDSTAQVLTLLEMGADVTIVTARTCHLTEIGRKNIDNLARYARTIEVVPNMTVRAKLNRLGLELVGDISWPEHAAIFSTPFRAAVDLKIPLIMYGECPQAEYGGPMGSEQAMQMTRRWRSEFGGFLGLRPTDFVGMEGITARDMADYEMPSIAEMAMSAMGVRAIVGGSIQPIEAHFLGSTCRGIAGRMPMLRWLPA